MSKREDIAVNALIEIRDSTYRSAVILRAMADQALQQIIRERVDEYLKEPK